MKTLMSVLSAAMIAMAMAHAQMCQVIFLASAIGHLVEMAEAAHVSEECVLVEVETET